jgi:hypothetical protein
LLQVTEFGRRVYVDASGKQLRGSSAFKAYKEEKGGGSTEVGDGAAGGRGGKARRGGAKRWRNKGGRGKGRGARK